MAYLPQNGGLTSSLLLAARLDESPPERRPVATGWPRERGPRQYSPRQMYHQRVRRVTLLLSLRQHKVRLVESWLAGTWFPAPLKVMAALPLTGSARYGSSTPLCACLHAAISASLVDEQESQNLLLLLPDTLHAVVA